MPASTVSQGLPPARPGILGVTVRAGVGARRVLRAVLWSSGLVWMGGAFAGAADCYAFTDRDRRAECLAVFKQDHDYCYAIRVSDDRMYCLARVKRQRSHCYAIKGDDSRRQCLAVVR